jgi:hypothetical protein
MKRLMENPTVNLYPAVYCCCSFAKRSSQEENSSLFLFVSSAVPDHERTKDQVEPNVDHGKIPTPYVMDHVQSA